MNGQDLDDLLLAHLVFDTAGEKAAFDERQLGRDFDLPRAQVRASLGRLVENGVIRRAPRVGTVPAQAWRRHDILRPANNSVHGGNARREFRVVSIEPVKAAGVISARLGVAPGTTLTRIHRVSLIGEAVVDSWVVWSTHAYEDYLVRQQELRTMEWNDIVGEMTGLDAVRVRRASSTIQASRSDAEQFSVRPGTPLNFTDVTVSSPEGELIARCFTRALSQRSINVSETIVRLDRDTEGLDSSPATGLR